MSALVAKARETMDRRLWGGRSLHVGEAIILAIAVLLYMWGHKIGLPRPWIVPIIFAMVFLAFLIW